MFVCLAVQANSLSMSLLNVLYCLRARLKRHENAHTQSLETIAKAYTSAKMTGIHNTGLTGPQIRSYSRLALLTSDSGQHEKQTRSLKQIKSEIIVVVSKIGQTDNHRALYVLTCGNHKIVNRLVYQLSLPVQPFHNNQATGNLHR